MSTLGFLGCGAIGRAISDVHEKFDQNIIRHDLCLNSKLSDLLVADVIFVCLPTPSNKDGSCNLSIIHNELCQLNELGFNKTVVMKSTVPPGTGQQFSKQFSFKYVSCPEFLREHNARQDYLNQNVHIVGYDGEDVSEITLVLKPLNSTIKKLPVTEAELVKYFHNTYNAWRITFANSFYDMSHALDANYNKILNAFCELNGIKSDYLKSSDEFKGFGGPCLPKDTAAMADLSRKLKLNSNIWEFMLDENDKRIITLPPGLRESGFKIIKDKDE